MIKWTKKLTSREVNCEKPRFKCNTVVGSINSTEFRAEKQVRKGGENNKELFKKNMWGKKGGRKDMIIY